MITANYSCKMFICWSFSNTGQSFYILEALITLFNIIYETAMKRGGQMMTNNYCCSKTQLH